MTGILASLSDVVLSLHGALALAVVFAVPLLEASAFLGFVFPGEIAVLLGGVLAFQGRIPLWAAIVAAVSGAIIGDSLGYFVGKRWGRSLLRAVIGRVPFIGRQVDEHLNKAEDFLRRRGGSAVFFGRFTAALRVMVPGLAGMAEIPYLQFAAYNVAGGIVWGAGFVLLGYFAGAAWREVAGIAGEVGAGLLGLILIGLVGGRVLRAAQAKAGERPFGDVLAATRSGVWLRARFPSQSAWLARRMDTTRPRGFLLTLIVVAGSFSAWFFGALTQDVVAGDEAARLDPGIERWILAHRVDWLTPLMKTVTWLGSNWLLIPLIAIVGAVFLLRRRGWLPGAQLLAALVGAIVLYDSVSAMVERLRPPPSDRLVDVSGFSFPSGHATQTVAFWGMLAIILSTGRSARAKVGLWIGWVLIAVLVGSSRMYLGVHWYTDVIGGYALGGAWLAILATGSLLWPIVTAKERVDDRDEPLSETPVA